MNPIADAAEGVFRGVVKPILDKWIPDATERLAAENLIFNSAQAVTMAQIDLNKIEAGSVSMFVAGWRPAIGWICAMSLFYACLGYTFMTYALHVYAWQSGQVVPELPKPDTTITMELLIGMLGLGGYRTFEKIKGLAK